MAGDHHHPLHHPAAVSYGKPETEPRAFGFWDFGPTPPPGFALANVQPPLLPPCHLSIPTTSQHHPTPPFHTGCPKLSHGRSVFGILAQPPLSGFALADVQPPAASVSSTRTHHILASSYAAVSHGTPETEQRALSFWDFGPTPAPRLRVGKRAAPPLPLCHQLAPTTS